VARSNTSAARTKMERTGHPMNSSKKAMSAKSCLENHAGRPNPPSAAATYHSRVHRQSSLM
jgi:hypothetical protein